MIVLRGGTGQKRQRAVAAQLATIPRDDARVLLATGKYIGEGFDDPRLDTLFVTLPISWRGTVAQYVGRLHRLYDGKREVRVYDYADLAIPMLARMFDRRCRGYEAVGYTINLPASAIPGWPADVLLPIDPLWKRDYAASVRRLVHDGVDVPLAHLFVGAARPMPADAEGANRARSASEAFLYRRLDTLNQTKGRFQLNADLSIHIVADVLWRRGNKVLSVLTDPGCQSIEGYGRVLVCSRLRLSRSSGHTGRSCGRPESFTCVSMAPSRAGKRPRIPTLT